jgi:hypothetical protein
MNKTLTVMTGLGVGAVLICLFDRAKRKPRGGSVCERASNVAGEAEGAVHDDVVRLTGAKPDESPRTDSALGSACGSVWSLAGRILPRDASVWRPVYRSVCRLSFRVCLCAAGLRIVRHLLNGRTGKRPADFRRKKFSKKECLLVTGYAALAFLARLSLLRLRPAALTPDGVYYATLGKHLVSGNLKEGLSTFWPPLYPLLVGLSSQVSRDVELGGRWVSVMAGSLLVIPVYLLGKVLYGEGPASVGALLVAAHPILIHYSTHLLTEATYTLLLTTVLYAGLTALTTLGRGAFFVTGVALGACYLTRPEAIGYAGLMLALTFGAHLSAGHLPHSAVLTNVLSLLLGFSLLALPYILFLRLATGRWTVSDKLHSHVESGESRVRRWFGLTEGRRTTLADRLYAGLPDAVASSDRRALALPDAQSLRGMARRGIEAFGSEIRLLIYRFLPPHFTALIGLGLFKAEWAKEIYLLLFLGSTLAGYALYPDIVGERLLVPLLPLSLCWAAKGVCEVETWLGKLLVRTRIADPGSFTQRSLPRLLVSTGLLFLTLPWSAYTLLRRLSSGQLEFKRAGTWVREQGGTPALIMAPNPHTAFYAGGRPLYLPAEEYLTVIEHASRHRVDYLVIEEDVVTQNIEYSNLRFLLDERNPHPGLRLVYKFDGVPQHNILVFTLT